LPSILEAGKRRSLMPKEQDPRLLRFSYRGHLAADPVHECKEHGMHRNPSDPNSNRQQQDNERTDRRHSPDGGTPDDRQDKAARNAQTQGDPREPNDQKERQKTHIDQDGSRKPSAPDTPGQNRDKR
jgi:hypothetical protein